MNAGTITVALIVAAIVAAIIVKLVRDKRRGVGGCGCSCEDCGSKCSTEGRE